VAIGDAVEHGAYRGRRAEEECTGNGVHHKVGIGRERTI
jgi:hypothetical protein